MNSLNDRDRNRIINNINSNINSLNKFKKEIMKRNYNILDGESLTINLQISYLEYYKDKILKDDDICVAQLVDDFSKFLDSLRLSEQTKQIILLHVWLIEIFARFEGININE